VEVISFAFTSSLPNVKLKGGVPVNLIPIETGLFSLK